MRALLIALTWIVAVIGFGALAFAYDSLARATAQADGDDVAVWLYTPHVGPGDTLRGEIAAYGGIALGIRAARIRLGEAEETVRGRGQHWRSSIRTKSTTSGDDSVEFALTLPADLEPGAAELRVDVDFVRARRSTGGFQNDSRSESLAVPLAVRTAPARIALRLWSLLRAALGFLALAWLYLRFGPGLTRDDRPGSEAEIEGLAYLALCIAVFVGLAGYPLFAQPLMAAVGSAADALVITAMIAWVLGPPITAWRVHKARPRSTTWRIRFGDTTGRTAPDSVARVIGLRGGLDVRPHRRGFTVRVDRRRLARFVFADRARVEGGATVECTDDDLLFAAAVDLAEKAGPLTLVSAMVELPVARGATVDAIRADHGAQVRAAVDRLMASMQEMRASMDGLMARVEAEKRRR